MNEQSIKWDELTYCIRSNGTVFHPAFGACYYCCERCNTWTHNCYGCGDSVPHGRFVCDKCDAEIRAEADYRHGRE